MLKYSENYTFEKSSNFLGLAEAGVAFLIFAGTFLWLFI
jgi:hypothetical protein